METESQTKEKIVVYYVSGEEQTTEQHKLTVRTILSNAGFTLPEEYRLIRDEGDHAYKNLDEEVPLHEGEKFTALFEGPTPTS